MTVRHSDEPDPVTRIIGGAAGGRRLADPARRPHPAHQRPGPRGAVLRRRAWCGSLHGLRFLDLYAGSGAVGLEALVARAPAW